MAQRSPPQIMDACKQGSEKTIYALAMDLSSTPPHRRHTSTVLPSVICQRLMENNGNMAVVGRYFNKNAACVLTHHHTNHKLELSGDKKYNKQ